MAVQQPVQLIFRNVSFVEWSLAEFPAGWAARDALARSARLALWKMNSVTKSGGWKDKFKSFRGAQDTNFSFLLQSFIVFLASRCHYRKR